jgi:MscS family membrane protein
MTTFLNSTYYGNTILTWLIALLLVVLSFVMGKVLYWISNRWLKVVTGKTKTELDDVFLDMIEEPLVMIITLIGFRYSLSTLKLEEEALLWSNRLFHFLIAVIFAWLAVRLYEALHKNYLSRLATTTDTDLDDQLLPVLKSGVRFVAFSLGIIIGLNNAGYDVGTIIAGLGIGGLAFALVAQDSVANLFGGVIVFMHRPFKTGDRIKVAGVEGYVREVGLRSSLLETISGEKLLLPNKVFSGDVVSNLDIASFYFQQETFRLHRSTSPEQLELILGALREAASQIEEILWVDPILAKVGDYSFDVEVPYGVKSWQPNQTFAHHLHKMAVVRSQLNLVALKVLAAYQIKLALPVVLYKDQMSSENGALPPMFPSKLDQLKIEN